MDGGNMKNNEIEDLKRKFLHGQIFSLAIMGGFQRGGGIYGENINDKDKKYIKDSIREFMKEFLGEYQKRAKKELDNFVISKVKELADDITEHHRDNLKGRRFRIGTSQKIIGLYLKYMWVVGTIKTPPPVCPFDRSVINVLGLKKATNWTKMDDFEEYNQWINAARDKARKDGFENIALWELKFWQEKVAV
jgi:hypothetical protein